MRQSKSFFSFFVLNLFFLSNTLLKSQTPFIHQGFPNIVDTIRGAAWIPLITDLDKDGKKEIIIWQTAPETSKDRSSVYVIKHDGTGFPGFPKFFPEYIQDIASGDVNNDGSLDIVIRFRNSITVLSKNGNELPGFPFEYPSKEKYFKFSINIFDLDNDGKLEIISARDNSLIVLNSNGEIRPGWEKRIDARPFIWNTATGDIDNDGYAEIFLTYYSEENPDFNFSGLNPGREIKDPEIITEKDYPVMQKGFSGFVDAFRHDGTRLSENWPVYEDSGYTTWGASPSLYINHQHPDSTFILVPSFIPVGNPPAYAINRLTMYNKDGVILKRSYHQTEWSQYGTFAIADLNNDGTKELISGAQNEVNVAAFNLDLEKLDGWPRPGNGQHEASVIIGKFANGNNLSIMANEWYLNPKDISGYAYVYDPSGNNLKWSPLRPTGIVLSTACADLDNDGSVEIVAVSYHENSLVKRAIINVWTIPGIPFVKNNFPWPQINHDRYRSNQYGFIPVDEPVRINNISSIIPDNFIVYQNYPNPFNPSTKIKLDINKADFVNLKVYDQLGREKLTLINQILQPGVYEVNFDGSEFSSGIYFYTFESTTFKETKKMILLR